MQFLDALCCVFLMVTLTATCVRTEKRNTELRDVKIDKRLSRTESAVILDNFLVETVFKKPKIIYRKMSKHRYGPPKPKFEHHRTMYGLTKPSRKPGKKYRNTSPKYGPPSYKKRSPKPSFASTKKQNFKSHYEPPKKHQQYTYFSRETSGFGEPPTNYDNEYRPPKTTYGEPPNPAFEPFMKPFDSYGVPVNPQESYSVHGSKPTDSYGVPIKMTDEPFPITSSSTYPETSSRFENHDYGFDNEYKLWNNYQNDQKFEPSNKKPSVNHDIFVTPSPADEEAFNLNSYSDIYMHRQNLKEKKQMPKYSKHKRPQFPESYKVLNRPWKTQKARQEPDDEVIVGGQYAEPPARYVPKFQPSAPMFNADEEFPQNNYGDSDSATISPYVNYKNSNLAFSPQNLNDAFSIVDN